MRLGDGVMGVALQCANPKVVIKRHFIHAGEARAYSDVLVRL